jgi:putative ABC transport system permease protein
MELKYALRSLRKNPGFTILAVLVMGLGIGANSAVFSVVNSVLLRPLDYHDPDRIVTIESLWKKSGNHGQVSGPDFHDFHDQSSAFSAMSYYYDFEIAVSAGAGAEYAHVTAVTPEFLDVFDIKPVVGRAFQPDELKYGSGAACISYAYWQSHYGGSPAVLGRNVHVFGKPLAIVGVLPRRFGFPNQSDIWYPADALDRETASRSAHNYRVVGRLKPGVALPAAQIQMASIATRLEQLYPDSNRGKNVAVTTMRDTMVSGVRLTLYLMLGAVALVLLIACANVANLLLAKATTRTREIAIRTAMGASRLQIVRQLITESLALGLASGAAGLLLAGWVAKVLIALAPADVPRLLDTSIDGGVMAFTFSLSLLASLLFGLAPALQASRVDLNEALKSGSGRATSSGGAGRIRNSLVVAEIALSVVLLAGAGLLMKSFIALHNVALGFHPENVLVMGTSVPAHNIETARRAAPFYRDLMAQAASLPGVISVGAARVPPGEIMSNGGYWIDQHLGPGGLNVSMPQAVFSVVAPGTFPALGIPVKAGRDFSAHDRYDAPFTAIVNEALARQAFPGQDPIGHIVQCGFDQYSMRPMRIVGVVGDIRQQGPAGDMSPEIYMPNEQHPGAGTAMKVVVKTVGDPTALAEILRRKARELSPDVPVKFTTLEASLAQNVAAPRFRTLLLGIFAGLAVSLAMAGVYGVMAYVVGQRSSEIGLRMAIGASPGDILSLVLRQGMKLAAIGLVFGLAGAAAATRLLTKLLFQVKPTDPLTYAGVALVLGTVALGACYFPARHAMKVDPLVALRQE